MKLSALQFAIIIPIVSCSFIAFSRPISHFTGSIAVAATDASGQPPAFNPDTSKIPLNGSNDFTNSANTTDSDPKTFIANTASNILSIALLLVGIIAVFFLVLYGFQYLTAGGDPEKAKKARGGIINAVIGIAIIVSAFAFVKIGIQGGSLFQEAVPSAAPGGTSNGGTTNGGTVPSAAPGRTSNGGTLHS